MFDMSFLLNKNNHDTCLSQTKQPHINQSLSVSSWIPAAARLKVENICSLKAF